MKKILLALIATICFSSTDAVKKPQANTNINPRGLFRMQYVNNDKYSETRTPSFEQYYFCSDSLAFMVNVENISGGQLKFYMANQNKKALNYTGMQKNSKELQIYDTTKDGFKLRWYNDFLQNSAIFPYNEYSIETYNKENMLVDVVEAFEYLQLKDFIQFNRFTGVWKRRGLVAKAGNTSKVYGVPPMYKIYAPNKVVLLYNVEDTKNSEHAVCEVVGVKYYDDNMIKEMFGNGSPCIIQWIDNSSFTLTYLSNGTAVTEVWDRCGLPKIFQDVFGTKEPITNKVYDEMLR